MTLYFYGFVDPEQPPPPPTLGGVAGAPVEILPLAGSLAGAVSTVPDADFSAEAVEERLRDLDWLGEQGALHERVVTWFADHGDILPARFLTLHSDAGGLADAVRADLDTMERRFRELAGRREWDLKVAYDRKVLEEHLAEVSEEVAAVEEELAGAGPGRRYLLERKRDTLLREEVGGAARRLAGELVDRLEELAPGMLRLPLPDARGRESPVVANAALLLDGSEPGAVGDEVQRARERLEPLGLSVDFTGPWAPYRFVDEE